MKQPKRAVPFVEWLLCVALSSCGGSNGSGASSSVPTTYDAFSSPITVSITGYSGDAMEPFISKDGQYLFFNNRNDPSVNTDLFYAARVDDQTFTLVGPIPGANSPQLDAVASLDTLGNFYFISTRSYSTSLSTVYSGPFTAAGVGSVGVVAGVSLQKSGVVNFDAEISADGQTLWFDDGVLDRLSDSREHRDRRPAGDDVCTAKQQCRLAGGGQQFGPELRAQHLDGWFGALFHAYIDRSRRYAGHLSHHPHRYELGVCHA
jgi:hypothetical protein